MSIYEKTLAFRGYGAYAYVSTNGKGFPMSTIMYQHPSPPYKVEIGFDDGRDIEADGFHHVYYDNAIVDFVPGFVKVTTEVDIIYVRADRLGFIKIGG